MRRRSFLLQAGGIALTISTGPPRASSGHDRVGMGTVIFRHRFARTRPQGKAEVTDPLSLVDVPGYYRDRFGIRLLEFWSHHFESLDRPYLEYLRERVKAAGAQLINVQVDADYDLASAVEEERQRSLAVVRQWIDAASLLGTRSVRINPGKSGGSVEKSIASLKEVNQYCVSKRLPLLTENHFGLEMDPDVHMRIRRDAGPGNIYTLPDFGNYPADTMWKSLEKILPYAWLVSAKAVDFNERGEHLSYDFDRCVRMCERAGFTGLYLVEQWSRREQPLDAEKIADWLLERVRAIVAA